MIYLRETLGKIIGRKPKGVHGYKDEHDDGVRCMGYLWHHDRN